MHLTAQSQRLERHLWLAIKTLGGRGCLRAKAAEDLPVGHRCTPRTSAARCALEKRASRLRLCRNVGISASCLLLAVGYGADNSTAPLPPGVPADWDLNKAHRQ